MENGYGNGGLKGVDKGGWDEARGWRAVLRTKHSDNNATLVHCDGGDKALGLSLVVLGSPDTMVSTQENRGTC